MTRRGDGATRGHGDFCSVSGQERQLQRFDLTGKQAEKLADYLQGTRLLVDCLKLATVRNREGIMRRLLSPPGVV